MPHNKSPQQQDNLPLTLRGNTDHGPRPDLVRGKGVGSPGKGTQPSSPPSSPPVRVATLLPGRTMTGSTLLHKKTVSHKHYKAILITAYRPDQGQLGRRMGRITWSGYPFPSKQDHGRKYPCTYKCRYFAASLLLSY